VCFEINKKREERKNYVLFLSIYNNFEFVWLGKWRKSKKVVNFHSESSTSTSRAHIERKSGYLCMHESF
jgi:hypothetical protein